MRVFIGEYICGGGMRRRVAGDIDASMMAEGGAMLAALAEDVSKVAELSIPIDQRFCPSLPPCTLHEMDVQLPLWGQWVRAAQGCDAAILIAPESSGVLAKAVGMLRSGGIDVIASSGDFLRATSDKQITARLFASGGVPHPITFNAEESKSIERLRGHSQYILKPRDGCGTKQILVFENLDDALTARTKDHVLQSFVPGKPISIAAIAHGSEIVTLPAVSQDISLANCAYLGGCGPLPDDEQRRAAALAQKALAALPMSARGFIGFDLILAEENAGDVVVEVNARLTTSYVGLRHIVLGNLAARLLGLESGPVHCKTNADSVRWTPSGQVWLHDQAITNV